jgi:hypothetical protein
VETKPKSNSVITTELLKVDSTVMGIIFKVKGEGELKLELDKLTQAVKERGLLHGLTQRVIDRAAIARSTETGKSATPKEKFDAMKVLVEHLNGGGEWELQRVGAGPSAEFTLLVDVLCKAYPAKTREQLSGWAKGKSAGDRAALLNEPRLKVIAEELRAERAKGVDAGALLSELEAEGAGPGGEAGEPGEGEQVK